MDGEETLAAGTNVTVAAEEGSVRLWAEMLLVYGGIPGLLIVLRHFLDGLVIPIIMTVAFTCWLILKRDASFDRRRLWNAVDFGRHFKRTLTRFLLLGLLAAYLSYLYLPGAFLAFPIRHLLFWLMVMICYPIFSAYPQEIIYRTFFFFRYRRLFKSDTAMMVVSALLFGWAHAFLGNWIAPVFASLGGIFFGWTYLRSGSTLQASLEHGLWGDLLFTLGTGWFFYAGSI
jgi:membrane protease YdiL (CAAX protease family)